MKLNLDIILNWELLFISQFQEMRYGLNCRLKERGVAREVLRLADVVMLFLINYSVTRELWDILKLM